MFEESMAGKGEKVELRGMVDREIVDVLDAVSTARRMARNELAELVLREWARGVVHESILIQRVTRGNGSDPESSRNGHGTDGFPPINR